MFYNIVVTNIIDKKKTCISCIITQDSVRAYMDLFEFYNNVVRLITEKKLVLSV